MAKKKKADEESIHNVNDADDTFGLPEIEYEPIHREETKEEPPEEVVEETIIVEERIEEPSAEEETLRFDADREEEEPEQVREPYSYSFREEKKSSPVGAIVISILIVLALAAGGYWLFVMKPEQDREKAQMALAQRQAEEKRLEEERNAAQLREQQLAEERRVADSLANAMAPKEGVIETLSERTGRYYVVVASAIDDDLLMDNAQKLSKNGAHVRIIPPFRNVQFFRMAVDDGDTYADAQSKADNLKGEYGDGVWVIKY